MTVAKQIEIAVENVPIGTVFTVSDLDFPADFSSNVKVKLNRMVKAGKIQKLASGKYYKAKKSVFGQSLPSTDELVKDILYPEGKVAGYLTGSSVWSSMQLTTQFSGNIVIGTNVRKSPLKRAGQKITFIIQPNKITRENIHLLQILDALKFIKNIPDTSVTASVKRLKTIIDVLSEKEKTTIARLALSYPPRVRALLGAIMDDGRYDELGDTLYHSLNHISEYRLGITDDIGINTYKWHIR